MMLDTTTLLVEVECLRLVLGEEKNTTTNGILKFQLSCDTTKFFFLPLILSGHQSCHLLV